MLDSSRYCGKKKRKIHCSSKSSYADLYQMLNILFPNQPAGCGHGRRGKQWPCIWWAVDGGFAPDTLWGRARTQTKQGSGLPPTGSLPWTGPVSLAAKPAGDWHPIHSGVHLASCPNCRQSYRKASQCQAWWWSESSPCWECGSSAHSSTRGISYQR